jgi:hypothetical protein
VTKDKWQHPLFLKINYFLTTVWGLMFLLGIVLHIIKIYYPLISSGWAYECILYIPSIFGILVTIWFPAWYKKYSKKKRSLFKINAGRKTLTNDA